MTSSIGDGEIHVWHCDLDDGSFRTADGLLPLLSQDEQTRTRSFLSQDDAARFAAGRATLRILLSEYIGEPPAGIEFCYSKSGRPEVSPRCCRRPIPFSVSHSRGKAIMAFSPGFEIGADIEHVRPMPFDSVVRRFFAPDEIDEYSRLPADIRSDAFFACWTRKEALIKAVGGSILSGIRKCSVAVAPSGLPAVKSLGGLPGPVREWSLRDLDAGPGFRAAIAAAHPAPVVRQYRRENRF